MLDRKSKAFCMVNKNMIYLGTKPMSKGKSKCLQKEAEGGPGLLLGSQKP